VCLAFAQALGRYGVPDEVLTDNGKQFTARFGRGGEVLFDRICRDNGVVHRLTQPATPTTTGKVEPFHQTLRRELLNDHGPFEGVEDVQAALDGWVADDYNTRRPHQSLGMAAPAERFSPVPEAERGALPLRLPAALTAAPTPLGRDEAPEPALGLPTLVATPEPSGSPAVRSSQRRPWPHVGSRSASRTRASPSFDPDTRELLRTRPSPFTYDQVARLRGGTPRRAAPETIPRAGRVQRRASNTGVIMVASQKVALGRIHTHTEVTVYVAETTLTIKAGDDTRTVARTTTQPVRYVKAAPAPQGRPMKPRPTVAHHLRPNRQASSGTAHASQSATSWRHI
jgi:hypothetical protein